MDFQVRHTWRVLRVLAVACLFVVAAPALADPPTTYRPIAGFEVRGKSKVNKRTLSYLAHVRIGDLISESDLPEVTAALISSELFETAEVALEPAADGVGVIVVATVSDKMSWIAAPTLYVLSTNKAVGAGYAETDFRGNDQKLLLYGQLGTQTSLVFATFLDPAVHGTRWQYRIDLYAEHFRIDEYANPLDDETSQLIARETTETFLDAGFLVGYSFQWWLVADLRLRGAYVYFRDPHDPDTGAPLGAPETDGWDVSAQARVTLDRRIHRFGVTTGPYLQAEVEPSIPGLDSYGHANSFVRAYYSWELFPEQELEIRTIDSLGYHLPFHEENSLGGVGDLRGYPTDQFRGDLNVVLRMEYSVPLFKWWVLAFRALSFYDWGYSRFVFPRPDGGDRNYLAGQLDREFVRDDIGAGLRVYVKAIVLPLVGIDVGYGIEGHSPEVTFELGLTDF